MKEAQEKSRKSAAEHRREKEDWQKERDNLESDVRSEVKRREKVERDCEQQLKQKEEEVLLSKERVVAIEREQRRLLMQLEELEEYRQKVKIMEDEADKLREEYDHLTARVSSYLDSY